MPKYGENLSRGTVTTWGPKFSIDLKYLGHLYRYEGDLCAIMWGPPRDVEPPCFPYLRCDNLGTEPEKQKIFARHVIFFINIDFLKTCVDPRGHPLPCAKIWGKSPSRNSVKSGIFRFLDLVFFTSWPQHWHSPLVAPLRRHCRSLKVS